MHHIFRGKRLKRTTEKRIAFDGREVIFVTECTQTDWKWKDNSEKAGRNVMAASNGMHLIVKSLLLLHV